MLSVLAAAVLAASPAAARKDAPAPRPEAAATQETTAVQLSREVLTKDAWQRLIDGVTAQVTAQIREMAEQKGARVDAGLEEGLRNLYGRIMPYAEMVEFQAGLLAKHFTEAEIVQLRDFYRTPVGMKMRDKMPELTQDGMAFGMRKVQERAQEVGEALRQFVHEAGSEPEPAKVPAAVPSSH